MRNSVQDQLPEGVEQVGGLVVLAQAPMSRSAVRMLAVRMRLSVSRIAALAIRPQLRGQVHVSAGVPDAVGAVEVRRVLEPRLGGSDNESRAQPVPFNVLWTAQGPSGLSIPLRFGRDRKTPTAWGDDYGNFGLVHIRKRPSGSIGTGSLAK